MKKFLLIGAVLSAMLVGGNLYADTKNDQQKQVPSARDNVRGVIGVNVTDGTDYEPTFAVTGMKLDATGMVEYELAGNSTKLYDKFYAGAIYNLYITKIYYTTGDNNTDANLGITLYGSN